MDTMWILHSIMNLNPDIVIRCNGKYMINPKMKREFIQSNQALQRKTVKREAISEDRHYSKHTELESCNSDMKDALISAGVAALANDSDSEIATSSEANKDNSPAIHNWETEGKDESEHQIAEDAPKESAAYQHVKFEN